MVNVIEEPKDMTANGEDACKKQRNANYRRKLKCSLMIEGTKMLKIVNGLIKHSIWCFLLSLTLAFISSLAAETTQSYYYENYRYTISNNEVMITECSDLSGDITIPYSIKGMLVTSIGEHAFLNRTRLTSVTIPNSVTSIGDGAFYGCYSLTNVMIPNSVTSIGEGPFAGCSALASIAVETANPSYSSLDGVLFDKNKTALIQFPARKGGVYSIPMSVTSIGKWAFSKCSGLTSVVIPDGVTSIGNSAFQYCSGFTGIVIPDSVTSIGSGAFSGCSGLTSMTIPNSVTSLEGGTFSNCSGLTSVVIGNRISSIGDHAFWWCRSLTSVTIPNSVTSIGDAVFYQCYKLTSVVIPDSVTSIGDSAFSHCSSLTSVVIPNSVTRIGDWAFYECYKLTSVVIPDSVSSIGDRAFYFCSSLTSVVIPDSVTSIGDLAFYECSSLTSVAIGDGVTSIGYGTFQNCSGLTSVVIPDNVTNIGGGAFYKCSSLTSVVIGDSVTSIGGEAFYKCSNLTSVVIGDSVTSIGGNAFRDCASLTSVMIPNSVTSIGGRAFSSCSSLTSVVIPINVSSIEEGTFRGCTSLTSVIIPANVSSIHSGAFFGCSSLESVFFGGMPPLLGSEVFDSVPGTAYYISGSLGWSTKFGGMSTSLWTSDAATPAAPMGLNASDGTTTESVIISWTASSNATGYKLYRGTMNSSSAATLLNLGGTSYADSTAGPGVLYYYWVKASNAAGDSEFSTFDIGFRALTQPTNVSASDNDRAAVTVSWSAVIGATHYRVFRATAADGVKTPLNNWHTALSYNDNTADAGTIYYYWVCAAVDGNGTRSSDFSSYATGFRALTPPTNVSASDNDSAAVTVSWSAVTGATHYRVFRATSADGVKTALGNWQSTLSYADNTAVPGAIYTYWVCSAVDGNGTRPSDFSSYATGFRALVPPTNVSASDNDSAAVTVSWSAVTGATHYRVFRATSADDTKTALGNWQTTMNYMDTTAVAGTTYYYWVSAALDSNGTRPSDFSSYATGFRALTPPANVSASDNDSTVVTVSWSSVPGATHYRVFRATSDDDTKTALGNWQTTMNYMDTTAVAGTTYYYWVSAALDSNGTRPSDFSSYATGFRALTPPTNVSASDNAIVAITVNWSAVTGATHYRVFRAMSADDTKTALGNWQSTLSYADTTAVAGTTYTYWVCAAVDSNGTRPSAYSASDTGMRLKIDYNYRITSDNQIIITGYTGNGGDIVIPSTIDEYTVTCIDSQAFYGCSKLTSIMIPDSVTSIGEGAFYNCSNLTSAVVPNRVTSIGSQVFYGCSNLTSIVIPDSVTSIEWSAFYNCSSLTSIVIGEGVTSIGGYAFKNCSSLISMVIPDSVTSIEYSAFENCSSLTSVVIGNSVKSVAATAFYNCSALTSVMIGEGITDIVQFTGCSNLTDIRVSSTHPKYSSMDGVLFDKTKTVLWQCPPGKIGEYEIPDSVTEIGYWAFEDCSNLTKIVFPDNVSDIENVSFTGCSNLTAVSVSSTHPKYSSIDGVLFDKSKTVLWQCPPGRVGEYQIPDGVIRIRSNAFDSCFKLTGVVIPDSVISIGNWAFAECSNLTSIVIPNSVTSIGENAFCWCSSLASVEIPDSVTSFGEGAFYACTSLTSVVIPGSITSIAETLFDGCSGLINVVIPDSVTSIGLQAFHGCSSLPRVTIPGSVTSIERLAFCGCSSLTSVIIPDSVTNIEKHAFTDCTSLVGIYFQGLPPWLINNSIFDNVPGVVYYISGTPGWRSTYGYLQTSIWTSTVTFESNDATPSFVSREYNVGNAYGALPTANRPGYAFEGWWTALDENGTLVTEDTLVPCLTAGHTLYAKFLEQVPPIPIDLNASDGHSSASVNVSWTASAFATGYKLYRSTSSNVSSATLLGSPGGTSYKDSTAGPGVLYYYWIKGSNNAGDSEFSTFDTGFRALAKPTNVSASNNGSAAVTVSWSAVTGATHYRVFRATSADDAKIALGNWQGTLSYADTTAVVGTTYTYWVCAAVDENGTRPSDLSSYATGRRINSIASPWGEPVTYPNVSMTVLAELFLYGGETVPDGSMVAVFMGRELRGKQIITNQQGRFFANLTVNVNNNGETLSFKLWNSSTQEISDCSTIIPAQSGESIGTPANPVELNFGLAQQTLSLQSGWNHISFHVSFADDSLGSIFMPVLDEVSKIISDNKNYTPGWGIHNTLHRLLPGLGHWVNMSSPAELVVSGQPLIANSTPIALQAGWNDIGFVFDSPTNVEEALSDILPQVEKIIGENENYTPGWGSFNSLTQLNPGKGYWVKTSTATTLIYQNASSTRGIRNENLSMTRSQAAWTPVQYPSIPYTLLASVRLDGQPAKAGDLVGIFVGDECRGVGEIIIDNGMAYCNLTITVNVNGEKAVGKLYDANTGEILHGTVEITLNSGNSQGSPDTPFLLDFTSQFVQPTYDFDFALQASWNSGISYTLQMLAGQDASDEYVFGEDQMTDLPLPPLPSPTAEEAFFQLPGNTVKLLRDAHFLDDSVDVLTWTLVVAVPDENPVVLSWDELVVPIGWRLNIAQSITPQNIINMANESSLIIEHSGIYTFTIIANRESSYETFTYQLRTGWNMICATLEMTPGAEVYMLEQGLMSLDTLAGNYTFASRIILGKAYWIFSDTEQQLEVEGLPVDHYELDIQPGWNFVGPSNAIFLPIAEFVVWEWTPNGYRFPQVVGDEYHLLAGKGYWLYCE